MASLYPYSSAFWAASEAWYKARKDAQAKAVGLNARVNMARKEAQWEARVSHYMRNSKGLSKEGWLRSNTDQSKEIAKLISGVAPDLVRIFDKHLGKTILDAWRKWPVGTGLSKSMLSIEYFVDGDKFTARLESRAPYSMYIKSNGDVPVQTLLNKPTKAAVSAILADLTSEGVGTK